MALAISCRVSAPVAGKSRRMGRAKTAVAEAASEPAAEATAADDEALLSVLAAGLRLQSTDSLWRVSGNTLPHRMLLRDPGGSLKRPHICWGVTPRGPPGPT